MINFNNKFLDYEVICNKVNLEELSKYDLIIPSGSDMNEYLIAREIILGRESFPLVIAKEEFNNSKKNDLIMRLINILNERANKHKTL